MADILGRGGEDGILADVGRVIADALDVARNEDEIQVIADARGVLGHARGKPVDDAVVQAVQFAVAGLEAAGENIIAVGKAADGVVQDPLRAAEHVLQRLEARQGARLVEPPGAARDAHGLVPDPLEVTAHFHGGNHFAQVVGQGLETHEDGHTRLVDGFFQSVNFGVVLDDLLAHLEIAGEKPLPGRGDKPLGERCHHEDGIPKGAQGVVKITEGVSGGGDVHRAKVRPGKRRQQGRDEDCGKTPAGPGKFVTNPPRKCFSLLSSPPSDETAFSDPTTMKNPLTPLAVLAATLIAPLQAQQLSGAGATFPAPLYQRWAVEYNKQVPEIKVNYQSVGSGAGVKNFLQGVVDFGASDAAMSDEEMAQSPRGAVVIPATAGSVVLAYNLEDVSGLKLSRAAMAGIFLGTIKRWNDPAIVATNPGVALPDRAINVAYRSDGSGTTYVFTQHLAAISPEFDEEVGFDKSVSFPVGVGGKGNEGVTALIKQTPGTIGYIEYGYAEQNGLTVAALENKSGNFVAPTPESGAAALASVEIPENLRVWPVDPATPDAYPIATFTWLLLYKKYDDAEKLLALKDFVTYGLTEGQAYAVELGYIPLPEAVVAKANAALSTVE